MNSKLIPFLIILLAIASFLAGSMWTKIRYLENSKLVPQTSKLEGGPTPTPEAREEKPKYPKTVGNFLITDKEECKEGGKPIIYFFGHSGCPHCRWQEPIVKETVDQFGDLISFHNNMDKQEDLEVLEEYREINPGYVPFLVFGCKYVRVGSGETLGKEEEKKALSAIICKLTGGRPDKVCKKVKDLVEEIK